MLTLYYAPGACSLAAHIVLEEGGEKYETQRLDLSKGEQRTEAYLKIHPQGRVPALRLDSGEAITENTAILPYLGKRFGLWPKDPLAETRALSLIGFFAASVHPAHAHISRPGALRDRHRALSRTSRRRAARRSTATCSRSTACWRSGEWLSDSYSVLDPYAFTLLHLGPAPRAAGARHEALHGFQGPHDAAPGRAAHRRGGEGQGVRALVAQYAKPFGRSRTNGNTLRFAP